MDSYKCCQQGEESCEIQRILEFPFFFTNQKKIVKLKQGMRNLRDEEIQSLLDCHKIAINFKNEWIERRCSAFFTTCAMIHAKNARLQRRF